MREYRINHSKLITFLESFNNENDNLLYSQKSFDLSYIGNRSEECLKKIKTGIDSKFKSIDESYKKISSWWNEYIKSIDEMESKYARSEADIYGNVMKCDGGIYVGNYVNSNSSTTPSYSNSSMSYSYVEKNIIDDFASSNYIDPELEKIISKYGIEVGNIYQLKKQLEDYKNELIKNGEELQKEYDEILNEIRAYDIKTSFDNKVNELSNDDVLNLLEGKTTYLGGFQSSNSSSLSSEEIRIKKLRERLQELSDQIEENKNSITMIDLYVSESNKQLDLIDYTYVLYTDDYKKFYNEFFFTTTELYRERHGIDKDYVYPHVFDVQYMTEDQRNVYWYYIYSDNKDLAKAEAYYKEIEDDINRVKGAEIAADYISNFSLYETDSEDGWFTKAVRWAAGTGRSSAKGIFDGVNTFFQGLENLDPSNWSKKMTADDYANMLIVQYLIQETDYGAQYKFSTALGNMLPAMTASVLATAIASPFAGEKVLEVLGPIVGSSLMGLSAGGNAARQATLNGSSKVWSMIYGILIGGSETIVGYFLSSVPGIGKNSIANAVGLKQALLGFLSEGVEEVTQDLIDNLLLRPILLGEKIDFDTLPGDLAESFTMGVLMSVFLGGSTNVIKIAIDGTVYNVEVSNIVDYISNNTDTKLSKAELKNLIKLNFKDITNNNTSYSKAEVAELATRYYESIKDIYSTKSQFDNYKARKSRGENVVYNQQYEDLINIENILRTNGIDVDSFYDLINESMQEDYNFTSLFLNELKLLATDNGGFINLGVIENGILSKQYDKNPTKIFNKLREVGYSEEASMKLLNSLPKDNIINLIMDTKSVTSSTELMDAVTNEFIKLKDDDPNKLANILVSYGFSNEEVLSIFNCSSDQELGEIFTGSIITQGNIDKSALLNYMINNKLTWPIRELLKLYGYGEFEINEIIDGIDNEGNKNLILQSIINKTKFEIFPEFHTGLSNQQYITRNSDIGNTVNGLFNSVYYNNSSDTNNGYGVDQGILDSLFDYYDARDVVYNPDGSVSLKPGARKYESKYVAKLEREGKLNTLPKVTKIAKPEYFELKNKLVQKGYSAKDASIIIKGIDSTGACSYAAFANQLVEKYMDRPNEFKKVFGFDLYKYDSNGKIININSAELLLDIYLYANDVQNGGKLFANNKVIGLSGETDVFGNQKLDSKSQVYMSTSDGMETYTVERYLQSKNPDIKYYSNEIVRDNSTRISVKQYNQILARAKAEFFSGKNISLNIFKNDVEIRMINIDDGSVVTTFNWKEGGGHAVHVTEITDDGFIVSSWGKRYLIPHEDLINGGRFTLMSNYISD